MAKKNTLQSLTRKYYDDVMDKIIKFVEEHQGEKGYIDTQYFDKDVDRISIYHVDEYNQGIEFDLVAIRVREGRLEMITEVHSYGSVRVYYEEESLKNEENWLDFECEDILHFESLSSIADFIEEYV